jgi:nucleoside-diphosphate-sugar epimerase
MRIAVTGGSGKVGRWVVRTLLDRGHQVLNLDRTPGDDARAEFIECDIRQREAVEPALRKCEAVCHLAEIPTSNAPYPKEEIYWSNARSAGVVLKTAADLGLRNAVYASTCQVYGCWGDDRTAPIRLPVDETCPVNPQNVYAISKAANELFARYLAENAKLSISVVRFPWVVAIDSEERKLLRLVHHDGPIGDGVGTYVHGSDLGAGIAAALETARAGFEIFNLGAGDVASAQPLCERLARHHPDFPRLPSGWPDRKSPLAIEKAERLLGWKPVWTWESQLNEKIAGELRQTR